MDKGQWLKLVVVKLYLMMRCTRRSTQSRTSAASDVYTEQGYTCHEFVQAIGEPVTVALRSRIPLETDLDIVHREDRWHLVDPSDPGTVILEATRWSADYPTTTPVSIEQAADARGGFPLTAEEHPAPHCLSCGVGDDSLQVQAGPLGDGRWATPLRLPEWAVVDGAVDMSLVWMAVDCSCGWYIGHSMPAPGQAVTVQFAVDVIAPIEPETDYALVAWHGDYSPRWDGRKRGAAAALFDSAGNLVVSSRSFWVSPA